LAKEEILPSDGGGTQLYVRETGGVNLGRVSVTGFPRRQRAAAKGGGGGVGLLGGCFVWCFSTVTVVNRVWVWGKRGGEGDAGSFNILRRIWGQKLGSQTAKGGIFQKSTSWERDDDPKGELWLRGRWERRMLFNRGVKKKKEDKGVPLLLRDVGKNLKTFGIDQL